MTNTTGSMTPSTNATTAQPFPESALARVIELSLDEDLAHGSDITTEATVDSSDIATVSVVSRSDGVVAGTRAFDAAINQLAIRLGYHTVNVSVSHRIDDGTAVVPGSVVLTVTAPTSLILTAERTALNVMGHLSGVATAASLWVREVAGTRAVIRDTRKTLPGFRALDKWAVRCGGGHNHRHGLGDTALIKDNHVAAAGSITAAIAGVRARSGDALPLEVEVDSLEQLDEVFAWNQAHPDMRVELVLLDNFPLWMTQIAVQRRQLARYPIKLESSGGLTLETAADYARTGVDYLAAGALTHSARALDLGVDYVNR